MEQAPENGKESLHSARDNGMNECKCGKVRLGLSLCVSDHHFITVIHTF